MVDFRDMQVEATFEGQRVAGIRALDDEARDLLADEALCELAVQEANAALVRGSVSLESLHDTGEDSEMVAIVLEAARKMHT